MAHVCKAEEYGVARLKNYYSTPVASHSAILTTLKNNFTKGIFKGLFYYTIGFVLAWLAYLILGWEYKHAPGPHHIIGFLFLVGGAGWIFYYLALLMTELKAKVNFGILTVHITAILVAVLFLALV